jgi:hypothetical protein
LKWIKLTGLVPTHSGVDSLGHVLFIKHERPDIYAKTYKFLEPMDFLTARLTGKITATQKTMVPFVVVDNRQRRGDFYALVKRQHRALRRSPRAGRFYKPVIGHHPQSSKPGCHGRFGLQQSLDPPSRRKIHRTPN